MVRGTRPRSGETIRLALEKGEPGARCNASVEVGVTARAIAEAIGTGTGLPIRWVTADEVERYFGWMATFAALDMTVECLDACAARMEAGRTRPAL